MLWIVTHFQKLFTDMPITVRVLKEVILTGLRNFQSLLIMILKNVLLQQNLQFNILCPQVHEHRALLYKDIFFSARGVAASLSLCQQAAWRRWGGGGGGGGVAAHIHTNVLVFEVCTVLGHYFGHLENSENCNTTLNYGRMCWEITYM